MLGAAPSREVRAALAYQLEREVWPKAVNLGQVYSHDPMQGLSRREGERVRLLRPVPGCGQRRRGWRAFRLQLFQYRLNAFVAVHDAGLISIIELQRLCEGEDVFLSVVADQRLTDYLI